MWVVCGYALCASSTSFPSEQEPVQQVLVLRKKITEGQRLLLLSLIFKYTIKT